TNCLQITGSVSYEFRWGDYEGDTVPAPGGGAADVQTGAANDQVVPTPYGTFSIATPGANTGDPDLRQDWYSKVEAWIRFVATADSDFGPARAVIKIKELRERVTVNEGPGRDGDAVTDDDTGIGGAQSYLDTYVGG